MAEAAAIESSTAATPEGAAPVDSGGPYLPLHPDLLHSLVDAVREPLIVCLGHHRGASGLTPKRILTANAMACALLNRDLESVQSTPLNQLVATGSGRFPPPGLVSKCVLHCLDAEAVSVECDCRVFSYDIGGGTREPLLFCHLALLDIAPPSFIQRRTGRRGRADASGDGPTAPNPHALVAAGGALAAGAGAGSAAGGGRGGRHREHDADRCITIRAAALPGRDAP